MDIIIYGSLHGAAKRYAEGLAERTGLKAVDYKEVDSLGLYKRVIYIGAIYASGVTGLKKTVAKMTRNQELFVATVGMVDPADEAFIGSFQEALKKQIPSQLYDEKKVFHLRGAIDYSQLELKYRILMKMMYSQAMVSIQILVILLDLLMPKCLNCTNHCCQMIIRKMMKYSK